MATTAPGEVTHIRVVGATGHGASTPDSGSRMMPLANDDAALFGFPGRTVTVGRRRLRPSSMGGLVGGPVAHRLIERLKARGAALGVSKAEVLTHDAAASGGAFTPQRLTVTILLIATCVALGTALSRWAENPTFTLPTFVWTLFVGVLIRNALAAAKLHEIDGEALTFVGAVSLSLFLAMALMSLRLWELAALAVPMFVILALQATGVVLYTTLVTFRVMGSNYEAAALVAGQCGFGLGATPTAIANMKQLVRIESSDRPAAPLLLPSQQYFLRENLRLRLLSARIALVNHDDASFKADIAASVAWVGQYFDLRTKPVQTLQATLKQMGATPLGGDMPDLSRSLEALRMLRIAQDRTPGRPAVPAPAR